VEVAIELIDLMLRWDPQDRPTAGETLSHPWFEGLHDESDEVNP